MEDRENSVIELNTQSRTIDLEDINEDVCEHCAFSRFKDTGPLGECRANPPTAGVVMMPRQNALGQLEPVLNPWTVFPTVERRTFCYTFEPKEVETEH